MAVETDTCYADHRCRSAVVRVSLPYTIVYSAVYWLDLQGIASHIEDINIDVTRGRFTVINASGIKKGDAIAVPLTRQRCMCYVIR